MARPDQVLTFHRVAGNRYALSGLRTGSVRDQIMRGQLLVERLRDARIIGPAPLIVVGGGAAGVAAALSAIALGVDVTLVELRSSPFHTQLGVHTRHLNPTEFDWPQPHFGTGDMSWDGGIYGLPYTADQASALAIRWLALWNTLVGPTAVSPPVGVGKLTALLNTDASLASFTDLPSGAVGVGPWPPYGAPGKLFGAAISCIGFSGEQVSVPSSAGATMDGPLFWSTDDLESVGAGALEPPDTEPIRVLVSGGGDGAQQDLLRILTGGLFGHRLYVALDLNKKALNLTDILLAEDSAHRAHAWSAPGSPPLTAYARWHKAYVDAANAIWQDWHAVPGHIDHLCQTLLRTNLHVTWLISSDTPGYCYGLNRLLALLVVRLHAHQLNRVVEGEARTGAPEVMVTAGTLAEVRPVGPLQRGSVAHVCGRGCHARTHDAYILKRGRGTLRKLGTFDVIVARHGITHHHLAGFNGAPVSEQLVPFGRLP